MKYTIENEKDVQSLQVRGHWVSKRQGRKCMGHSCTFSNMVTKTGSLEIQEVEIAMCK